MDDGFLTLCLYLYLHHLFRWQWKQWLLIWRDQAWLRFATAIFTPPLQIVLRVHIIIMWHWMGFKWGLKHMNYLLWYAQTLFVVTMATQLGPPTWNETFFPSCQSFFFFVAEHLTDAFNSSKGYNINKCIWNLHPNWLVTQVFDQISEPSSL